MEVAEGYVRVSTVGQEDGASLETQEAAIRDYAARRSYRLVAIHADTHTGTLYRERPALTALREQLRASTIDVVIAYSIDRLTRNQAHLYILAEEVESYGARLEFVTEDFEDSAVGRFIRSAKAFAAEVEHEKILERTMRGRRARAQSGKLIPGRKARYGYQYADETRGSYVVDLETAPVVERIYQQYTSGDSMRRICKDLTADGVLMPSGKLGMWSTATVRRILKDPAYKGVALAYGWTRLRGDRSQRFDEERAIQLPDGTIPPIVSEEIWEAAQERLIINRERASRNMKYPEAALLRGGFGRCGYCGHKLYVIRDPKKTAYAYQCGSHLKTLAPVCGPTTRTHIVDAFAWKIVHRIFTDPGFLRRQIEQSQEHDPNSARLSSIEASIAQAERQVTNLARTIAATDDPDVGAVLLSQMREVTERRRDLEEQRAAIMSIEYDWQSTWGRLDLIEQWADDVGPALDEASFADKQRILDLLGIRIYVWRSSHKPRFLAKIEAANGLEITL